MKFYEAIQYIEFSHSHGTRLTLEMLSSILTKLNNPHKNLKYIHVAGTNGKGSTSSFIHSILIAGGYQVGLFTSPHLHCYTDRLRINGLNILQDEFALNFSMIKEIIDPMIEEGMPHPAMFDLMTLLAFVYYNNQNVDYVVLEVGLGGLYDATNVIEDSLISVITPIAIDHIDVLGNNLEVIASHKAGIIKPKGLVVYHWQEPLVEAVIKKVAEEKSALTYRVEKEGILLIEESLKGQVFKYENRFSALPDIKIQMLGLHQIYNAAIAIETALVLRHNNLIDITDDDICRGVLLNSWAGRLELVYESPLVLIDGAHNLQGAEVLAMAIEKYFKDMKLNLVIGMLNNKDVTGVLNKLVPLCQRVIVTKPNNPNAIDPSELAFLAAGYGKEILITNSIEDSVITALQTVETGEATIFTGSLYLVGDVRRILFSTLENEQAS
ncbi:bifunctional folylpolyglutamate synthase/dihydrofolate synthase [Alkaliphilus peptidifermentans]|uniref:tetrahydrofolate synthase n=1 Tax=Alkaliphilus peptidifermentans DSM 18978 TaxID=1120976 RepID=A0A1G5CI88_9FIRM|nr:folylpolyglutamate synthase/dihydrofolate synthase family protein [Alkaliphilus peptidifermentans]SCY02010.1 dihydrofolate synthase / folylpolyglutamate synthase [Alkaliphilus peptidifermentans DSM 18978]